MLSGFRIVSLGSQGERRVRGGGIYPTAALLNHECLPNVARQVPTADTCQHVPFQCPVMAATLTSCRVSESCLVARFRILGHVHRFDDFDGAAAAPANSVVRFRTLHAVPKGEPGGDSALL